MTIEQALHTQSDPTTAATLRVLSDIMSRELHTIAPSLTLIEAAAHLAAAHVSSLVVETDGQPVGILTERDLLKHLSGSVTPVSSALTVADAMSTPVATAPPNMPFAEAWVLMMARRQRHLVVVDVNGAILGVATESDFRRHVDTNLLASLGGLDDLVERSLPQLSPNATLQQALALMAEQGATYVLAVEKQRATGILTERDIPQLLLRKREPGFAALALSDVAHNPVRSISMRAWVMEAAAQMQRLSLRHLVVVDDDGLLVGVIQQHNIMARMGNNLERWYRLNQESVQRAYTALAEERYRLAADAAQLGFWEYDVVSDEVHYSDQMLRILGATDPNSVPNVAHNSFVDRIHPDQAASVRAQIQSVLCGPAETQLDAEYQVMGFDGRWRWVHTRGKVVQRDGTGQPTRAMGVTMDIQNEKEREQALEEAGRALSERQAMLELLSDSVTRSPVVAMVWSQQPGWPVEFVTDNVNRWGYTPEDFLSGRVLYEALVHPDDLARIQAEALAHLAKGQENYDQSYRIRAASGKWLWVNDHTRIQRDATTGHVCRTHGLLTDVTERHLRREAERTEREVLEAMAQRLPLPHMLDKVVRAYEMLVDEVVCSILLVDPSGQHLQLGAAPSLPEAFHKAVQGLAVGPNAGSCGSAAFTGAPVIVTDIDHDPRWADFLTLAAQLGLHAAWSVPFKNSLGQVLGTFAVYSFREREPQAHEMEAIERAAYLAGLAVERACDQDTLRKLWMAVNQSPNAIVITDKQARIEYANQAFYDVSGYSPQEAVGRNPRFLQSGKTSPHVYEHMWESLQAGRPWQGEFVNQRKSGEEFIESSRISPVKQPDGEVTHYLSINEDITQRKATEQQIYKLAYFDALTGLPNRLLLTDRFSQALSMAKRQDMPMTLMFIDLDHFKHVNDTLGHLAGDELLVETARRLESALRSGDTLSRQGGDEFMLLLPNTGPVQAAQVAEKLMAAQAQTMKIEGHEVTVTLSIGIASYPNDGGDFNAMAKAADVAMYRAKEEGRNAYRFFTFDMQARSGRTLTLQNHLHRALERNEFKLVYHPQVSLTDGRLVGAEALIRWHHPTLGIISPAEFIPLAENSGAMLSIGEWVLRTAARQLKTWLDNGLGIFTVSVNLSAVQFKHAGLAAMVGQIVRELSLPPEYLVLELTESTAMSDPLGAVVAIDEITALGVAMAIDDFGTGYSSLSYLKRFKVSKLKIDKSFVQDITADPDDKAIVSAIIGLASNLGLSTIAEGVETPGQLAWLRLQGCDEAQGFFFTQPLDADTFASWVNNQRSNPASVS